ncbi:hypothetical protein Fcan01_17432 [Folsomia candida]|uniref:Uncharacterized protein n=1 Tax=Folsomia candida TaxID=158441 RepID=A0A226DS09_FOLCA|nr:hypothetical protein Fcan01_17432 [Folsomia candida]
MYYVANEHGVTNPFPAQLPEDLQRRAKERKYRPVDDLAQTSPFYKTLIGEDSPHHALNKMFPNHWSDYMLRVALTSFADWSVSSPKSSFYCFEIIQRDHGLTNKTPRNLLPYMDSDGWDSTLNAVYFTAIDSMIYFREDLNVIVFISNNKWKWSGDSNPMRGPEYEFPSPDVDSTKGRCKQGPVSKNVLYSALERHKILLIGLFTPKIYQEYRMFFKDAPHPENFHMLEINGTVGATDERTAAGIKDQIMPIIRDRACTCEIRYEFALIIDSTQTFIDKFRNRVYNLRTYLELAMPKIVFIVDKLLKEDPTAKLHLTTFGDYPTAQNHNENATYCYRYELTTSNKETFLTAVKTVDSTYGGIDKKESSLTAILYTATEPKIKWSSKDTKRVRPPIIRDVFKTLEKERFYLIPMIFGDNSRTLWDGVLMSVMKDKYFIEEEPIYEPSNRDFDKVGKAINTWANEGCAD